MPASCLADPPLLRDLMILFGREVVLLVVSFGSFRKEEGPAHHVGGGTLRCLLANVSGFFKAEVLRSSDGACSGIAPWEIALHSSANTRICTCMERGLLILSDRELFVQCSVVRMGRYCTCSKGRFGCYIY